MKNHRIRCAFATLGVIGWLYVPRGLAKGDSWTRNADMPTARSGCAAAVVDGKIDVLGGLATLGASNLSTIEVCDQAEEVKHRFFRLTPLR